MHKCSEYYTYGWGPDAIFDVECEHCGNLVEFFKDETKRKCSKCGKTIYNNRKDLGHGQ